METLHGIVTNFRELNDNDKQVSLFTREQGMIWVTVFGGKGGKNPMVAASQLFTYAEYQFAERSLKGMRSLKSAAPLEVFRPISTDYDKFKIGCYVLECINAAVHEGDKNSDCFELLYYTLSYLAYSDTEPRDIYVAFLLQMLKFTGFAPSVTHCVSCGMDLRNQSPIFFSNISGGALCQSCRDHYSRSQVTPLTLEIMRRILNLSPEDIKKIVIPDHARDELIKNVVGYAEHHLEISLR